MSGAVSSILRKPQMSTVNASRSASKSALGHDCFTVHTYMYIRMYNIHRTLQAGSIASRRMAALHVVVPLHVHVHVRKMYVHLYGLRDPLLELDKNGKEGGVIQRKESVNCNGIRSQWKYVVFLFSCTILQQTCSNVVP